MVVRGLICACLICAMGELCAGQVLYEAANGAAAPAQAGAADGSDGAAGAPAQASVGPVRPPQLSDVSLLTVVPPEPPSFKENDLVTIIISERSKTDRQHTFDSKKNYNFNGSVEDWIDMMQLIQGRLQNGDRNDDQNIAQWGLAYNNKFKGDTSYERDDSVTARVTARVVEVKPNGTLLLEARSTVKTDTDETSIVLSGMCRTEDVTDANTVQSNQMFDLTLNIQNPGDTRNGSAKGLIPKVLETLFNF